jgi:regulator of sigma E protease
MDFINNITQILTVLFWFIIILLPLVAIHELGHLLMARLVGVKVLEYGIGLPPRWKYVKWKGIVWSLNLTLLGGFARIYGDHDAIDQAQYTKKENEVQSRKDYTIERLDEILSNQETQFFLEENSMDYGDNWKWFEKLSTKDISELNEADQTKYTALNKQISTLIEWEYDNKINSKEAFFNVSWWKQTVIILGGITFNLISSVVFLWIMFSVTGSPTQLVLQQELREKSNLISFDKKSEYPTTSQVVKDTPADKIGLKGGDDIITFAGNDLRNLNNIDEFRQMVADHKNQDVVVKYRSKATGQVKDETVKLEEKDGRTSFGVNGLGYQGSYKAKGFFEGLRVATEKTSEYFVLTFKGIGDIFIAMLPSTVDRTALQYVSGPIAVSSLSKKVYDQVGNAGILQILSLISVSLAVFNLLPIPALDGGRLVILTLNRLTGKRNKKLEAMAITITMIALLLLGVFIAFRDVQGIRDGKF